VPLGRLNNLGAIRGEDTLLRSVFVTLLPAVPAAIGLFYSARYLGRPYPDWLEMLLWITYGIFLLGMLRAWWIPYLVSPDKERAARYQVIFAGTHSSLPKRNGMAPDTLHTRPVWTCPDTKHESCGYLRTRSFRRLNEAYDVSSSEARSDAVSCFVSGHDFSRATHEPKKIGL
jgi:hypothetical protein